MKFNKNPTADWIISKGINFEAGITCRLKCPGCIRTFFPKETLAHRSIWRFNKYIPILEVGNEYKFCGNHSDPIYHPDFLQTLKYLNDNKKNLTVSTNGSGKTKEWWKEAFSYCNKTTKWEFALDGIPEESHRYRVNQDGVEVWKIMKLGRSMGVNIYWQFIIFDYNKNDIETCKEMAKHYGINFYTQECTRMYTDKPL